MSTDLRHEIGRIADYIVNERDSAILHTIVCDLLTDFVRDLPKAQSGLLQVTPDLAIDPQAVVDLRFDHRHYMNGPGHTTLEIHLFDGRIHRVRHEPQYLGGADVYEIKKRIMEAWSCEQ